MFSITNYNERKWKFPIEIHQHKRKSSEKNVKGNTNDTGYLIGGMTESYTTYTESKTDIWLIKLDPNGNKVWEQTFGGQYKNGGNYDKILSLQITKDGEYMLVRVDEPAPFAMGSDFYVTKLNPYFGEAELLDDNSDMFNKEFARDERPTPFFFIQSQDGGYMAFGLSYQSSIWMVKIDSNGNKTWRKLFRGENNAPIWSSSVQETLHGYIIAGYTKQHNSDICIINIDSNGNKKWYKTFGGSKYDSSIAIESTAGEKYVILGETNSFGVDKNDIWLLKLDSDGNKLWDKTFGGKENDIPIELELTSDGGYLILGKTNSFGDGRDDIWVIKTNSEGNKIWEKTFGGKKDDIPIDVKLTSDEGYTILGETNSFGAGKNDIWVIKLDAEGNKIWDKTFGGHKNDKPANFEIDLDGGYIVLGETNSFGAGRNDIYVVKTDSNGNKIWDKTFGGEQNDYPFKVLVLGKE